MTKAKKYICILLIIITVLLSFSGCVAPGNQAYNNTETVKFLGYLKQDTESSFGKKSAVYDGRIYFQGQSGIYSMLPDGSDMQKEADAKDIRKIQITEDKMFFLDFTRIDNNHNGNCDECSQLINPSGHCSCFCHGDSFFEKLLFRFVNFFWKLFKINPICECGTKHW